jgi:hypothetical protein
MRSTATKRIAASMLLAFACGWTGSSSAAKAESAAAVVARLYKRSFDQVDVAFKDLVNGERTKIAFRLARVDGKWRIADILYGQQGTSLKDVLSRRMPR